MIFPHLRSRSTAAVPWEYDDDTPGSWKLRGLCTEYGVTGDNDPWYSTDPIERMEAVRICQQCPVRQECLDDATARGEQHGIWGGVEWLYGKPVDHTRTVGSRKGERRRRRRRDRLAEADSRLDTPEMRALIAAAQAELDRLRTSQHEK